MFSAAVAISFGAAGIGFVRTTGPDASFTGSARSHITVVSFDRSSNSNSKVHVNVRASGAVKSWLPSSFITLAQFRHLRSVVRAASIPKVTTERTPRLAADRSNATSPTTTSPPTTTPATTTAPSTTTAPAGSGPTSGMHLAFSSTFSGSQLDTGVWSTCYWSGCTNYGNSQEEEWYEAGQDQVSGGVLHLVATKTPTAGTDQGGAPKTYPYASGIVTTFSSYSFTYGYVQIVASIPGGAGTWPALWLLPADKSWPPEIDIMENWGSARTESDTFHWGAWQNAQQQQTQVTSSTALTDSWHTYGLAWAPGSLTWYLDGKVVATYTGSNVPSSPMYFLANLAIDGPAASGASFNIQSVRVWQH